MFSPTIQTIRLWIWAGIAGALGAASTIGFRWLTQQVEWLATGHTGGLVETAMSLPAWHRALVCAVGGLLAGLVLRWGGRWAAKGPRGDRNLDYIEAARAGRVDLNDRTTFTRTLSALFSIGTGASIGREGPTVHVGAGLMVWVAQRFGFRDASTVSRFALAGGAAGLAAAFNTPLAGVMFAIEELAGAFEHRFSGALLAAVMIAGIVSLGLIGDYAYFGKMSFTLPLGESWFAVLATGVVGGLVGGLFARLLLAAAHGLPGRLGALQRRSPVALAAICGLVLAAIGVLDNGAVFGTGYAQARGIIAGEHVATWFGVEKWLANAVSYIAGIPGGIFSPALAVGAGLGSHLAPWLPHTDPTAVILLGMAAYLSGVTQVPLTSTIITMELTDNHDFVLPIMATCLLSRAFSTLVCKTPIYRALALQLVRDREQEASHSPS